MNDTINVFQNPVDSVRVAAQDVTSEQVTNMLDFTESLQALWNLIHLEYIFFVCISYYIVVVRIPAIRANRLWKRNTLMFVLSVLYGFFGYFFRQTPFLSLLVTGLVTNAFYEFIFKTAFRYLEKIGITKLPEWYVEEVREEKQFDIKHAENSKR